jgi:hypothetical protein
LYFKPPSTKGYRDLRGHLRVALFPEYGVSWYLQITGLRVNILRSPHAMNKDLHQGKIVLKSIKKGVKKYAENKNKSICGKAVQKNRHGKIHLFEIECQPYFDKKNHQA